MEVKRIVVSQALDTIKTQGFGGPGKLSPDISRRLPTINDQSLDYTISLPSFHGSRRETLAMDIGFKAAEIARSHSLEGRIMIVEDSSQEWTPTKMVEVFRVNQNGLRRATTEGPIICTIDIGADHQTTRRNISDGLVISIDLETPSSTPSVYAPYRTTSAMEAVEANSGKSIQDILYEFYITQHLSLDTIAKQLNIGSSTVNRWLSDCGIHRA